MTWSCRWVACWRTNLTGVVAGLCQDDPKLHQDRIKLWENFNHAWLALFQAQKATMQPGRFLQRSQSLVSEEGLEKMGKELIRLCDGIERHGLVDYHYGVWEERILDGTSSPGLVDT